VHKAVFPDPYAPYSVYTNPSIKESPFLISYRNR
jgi:hypothetical protein